MPFLKDQPTVHVNPFKCDICQSCFSRKGNLNLHKRTVHENEKPFKCDICHSSFRRKGNWYFQMISQKSVDENEKPFKMWHMPKLFQPERLSELTQNKCSWKWKKPFIMKKVAIRHILVFFNKGKRSWSCVLVLAN